MNVFAFDNSSEYFNSDNGSCVFKNSIAFVIPSTPSYVSIGISAG